MKFFCDIIDGVSNGRAINIIDDRDKKQQSDNNPAKAGAMFMIHLFQHKPYDLFLQTG